MKIIKKTKGTAIKFFNARKINKTNRLSERQISEAIIESLFEDDENVLTERTESIEQPRENFFLKNELVIIKRTSDLLIPFHESVETFGRELIFRNDKCKAVSGLGMEDYNEIILLGSANNKVRLKDTQWLSSLMEQINFLKNNSEVFCEVETDIEEFCHYE